MNLKTSWPPILAALVVALIVIAGYLVPLPWMGLATQQSTAGWTYKTLWDWLDLLIVPAALAGLGFLFSRIEKRTELASAEARARSDALQSYLDQMSVLLVDKGLLLSAEDSPLRTVARARTLAVLKRQDGAGRGVVLQFLYESQLIGGFIDDRRLDAVVDLAAADLREVHADGLKLCGVVLTNADLSGASLRGADLTRAMVNATRMRGAVITPAYPSYTEAYRMVPSLIHANLQAADLTGAHIEATFEGARLDGATLTQADLRSSHFAGVELRNAKMKGANLRGAKRLDRSSLVTAETLEGVTLQDGSNALAPQKLTSEMDRQVTNPDTSQRAHIVGEAKGEMNVVRAEGEGGHIVGLWLSFYHHGVDHGPGLLVTDLESGDQWVSESHSGWRTLSISARTDVVAAEMELPSTSRTGSENRSLLLSFELALEATGRLKSWSFVDVSFS